MKDKRQIIFFDGVCNLCNAWVQWVIRRDKKGIFHFSSLQSEFAKQFLLDPKIQATDSIVFYSDGRFYIKSSAVLKLTQKLHFPYKLATVFFIVPTFLRNVVYDFVAKNRYKWYGKRESCLVPDANIKERFLE